MILVESLKKDFVSPVLDFLYPPFCLSCGMQLQAGEQLVCEACWQSIEKVHEVDSIYEESNQKFSAEGVVSKFISPFCFEKESKLQSIIHALKYRGYTSLGVKAGLLVGQLIKEDEVLARADYLIPVPLHRVKQRERGYNQSEFICRGVEEVTKIPTRSGLLHRKKYTVSQTQLSIEERKENVGDAFQIKERKREEIEGKSFILIDDVITTGSTINSCARELKNAGAHSVFAAAIALAK